MPWTPLAIQSHKKLLAAPHRADPKRNMIIVKKRAGFRPNMSYEDGESLGCMKGTNLQL
jgi:hypothetical protein